MIRAVVSIINLPPLLMKICLRDFKLFLTTHSRKLTLAWTYLGIALVLNVARGSQLNKILQHRSSPF